MPTPTLIPLIAHPADLDPSATRVSTGRYQGSSIYKCRDGYVATLGMSAVPGFFPTFAEADAARAAAGG